MLTPKKLMFVQEYLKDLNATQAAIRAGYSEKTAGQQGDRLLKDVQVATLVQEAMDKRSVETGITAKRVLEETARLAFSDLRRLFDEHGNLRPLHELDDATAAGIASFEVVTKRVPGAEPAEVEHVAKVKMWDKGKSLELLGRHLKLFTDKVEHTGPDGKPLSMAMIVPTLNVTLKPDA